MNIVDEFKKLLSNILNRSNADFVQYQHTGSCRRPCLDCPAKHLRIYANNEEKPKVRLANHIGCDCYYTDIITQQAGTISNKGILAPDVYLKAYGHLPDYYITKEEAINKYGWTSKNTIAGVAPRKMIGGVRFYNNKQILPEKEGRVWYECDVDYVSGRRNAKRLYYSNDGLMFYTETHDATNVIFIK